MTWKTILILFFASLLYVLPLYLFAQTHNLSWRLDSDYDSMWSSIAYPLTYLHTHHVFPKEHIYAGLGLPIRGDPFFQLYDPVALIPFFFLGLEKGMWLIVILTVFFSGVTMYFFVRSFSVSRQIALWGGLLYMFSGGLVAKVAAGHLIFLLTYPLWPLFFRVLMEPFFGKKSYILLAATIVLTFFHGDLYGLIFMAIFYFSSRLFFFLRKRHRWYHFVFQTLLLGLLIILFSFPKLFFVLQDFPNYHLTRYFEGTFWEGSLFLLLTPLPFFLPFHETFYDRPTIQRIFGFSFNWYEYYAFLSPLPFLFLVGIRRMRHPRFPLIVFLLIIGVLYISIGFPYSPFYWIFKYISFFHTLRVPQRIYLPLTSLVVIILSLSVYHVLQKKYSRFPIWAIKILLVGSVLWSFTLGIQTMAKGLEPTRDNEKRFIHEVSRYINKNEFILNLLCCTQTYLVSEHIRPINFYTAWLPNDAPRFVSPQGKLQLDLLTTSRPKYILAPLTLDMHSYGYRQIFSDPLGILWETNDVTISP